MIDAIGKTGNMTKLVVLCGGKSPEHNESIAMLASLIEELSGSAPPSIVISNIIYITVSGGIIHHVVNPGDQLCEVVADLSSGGAALSWNEFFDVIQTPEVFIFSLLQGLQGEDGEIQGLLNALELPSNAGPIFAAALSMNKAAMSAIALATVGNALLPIDTRIISRPVENHTLTDVVKYFAGRSCVVKPNNLGASIFAEPHESLIYETLKSQCDRIFTLDETVLVQQRIYGREISCGCLDMARSWIALPIIELMPKHGFMGRNEKFGELGYRREFVDDTTELSDRVKGISIQLARAIGFHTLCRFDYLVNEANEIFLLEANSKPGLLRESLYVAMLKRAGLSLGKLIELTIENERRRQARRCEVAVGIADFMKSVRNGV